MRWRIRWVRGVRGLLIGLLASALACLALTVFSFFVPIATIWRYLIPLAIAGPVFGAVLGLLWPVTLRTAARRADEAGLKERARTAIAFAHEDTPMTRLQRADAESALAAQSPRKAFPVRPDRRIWISTIAMALATAILLIVPNPQHEVLRAREQMRKELSAQADEVEQAAEKMLKEEMTDEERRELRRITSEMADEIRNAEDKRDALEKLDEKQKEMERLQSQIQERQQSEAVQALGKQPGLKNLAEAMQSGAESELSEALQELAESMNSADGLKELSAQLSAAAQSISQGALSQAMLSAAEAAELGDALKALEQMASLAQGAAAEGSGSGNLSALLSMARTGVAQSGQGVGAGGGMSAGGQGGGAGYGSTNQDAGYSPGYTQSKQGTGSGPMVDRVGEYERIYDPTRLGDGGDPSLVQGQQNEGDITQIQLGPGMGSLSGSVPYDQVIGEYSEAAAQAVRRSTLPASMQDWVQRYFDSLLEE